MGKKGDKVLQEVAHSENQLQDKNSKQKCLKEKTQEKPRKVSLFRRLTMRSSSAEKPVVMKREKGNPSNDPEAGAVKNKCSKTKKKSQKNENKSASKSSLKTENKNPTADSQKPNKKILKTSTKSGNSNQCSTSKDETTKADGKSSTPPLKQEIPTSSKIPLVDSLVVESNKSPADKERPDLPTKKGSVDGQKSPSEDLKSPVKTIKFAIEPEVQIPVKCDPADPVDKPKKPEIPRRPSILKTFKPVLAINPVDSEKGEQCGSRRPSDMVTMSSEKAAARRKTDSNNGAAGSGAPAAAASNNEDSPNQLVYKKMEQIVEKMQDEGTGVPVKTVKSFMSKIPSVFTGSDLIMWMMKNLDVEDQAEALHLAHLMAAHGYFFPIDDHMLTVKNDNTFYRFQTPYFWPSNCWEPENTDYAVYLCKRTMQNKTRLELADYEAENLARLQKMFSRKWEFIFMQAEAQSKVDKKRDKLERKVLDSQERAFWDVHRPMPGCVNTTEVDIKKACRVSKPLRSSRHLQLGVAGGRISPSTSETDLASPTEAVKRHIAMLKQRLDRRNIKVSKVAEACISYFEQYAEYDPFFTPPELPNPWVSDSPEYWEQEKTAKDISARRVKRWAFSLQELLQDPVGREHFIKFLDKEFSGENLKFWEAVQQLKALPQKDVQDKVNEIWSEFLAHDASCPINVDAQSYETTKKNMENTDRWSFDVAAAHVYHLMKSDSYSRYLRSEMYKEFLNGSKKKTSVKGIRSIVSFSARKETATS